MASNCCKDEIAFGPVCWVVWKLWENFKTIEVKHRNLLLNKNQNFLRKIYLRMLRIRYNPLQLLLSLVDP